MGKSWFGSLGLAAKYAFVFGCLLFAVVILGVIKIIYDKRTMRRHIRLLNMDSERDKDSANSEKALAMREKDEGDLFGIRALEAGYYGGVAQSRGNSIANSLAASPSPSTDNLTKADFSRPKPTGQMVDTRSRVFSASSSILRLSRFSPNEEIEVVVADPYRTDLSNTQRRKPANLNTVQLRPSTAEQNKRHNHGIAVDMNLQVPPSPLLQSGHRSSRDTRSSIDSPTLPRFPGGFSPSESPSLTPNSPKQPSSSPNLPPSSPKLSRSSRDLSPSLPSLPSEEKTNYNSSTRESSLFSGSSLFQEKVFPDYYSQAIPKVSIPGDLGKTAFKVPALENPHSDTKSVRGSLISRASIISHATDRTSYGPGGIYSPAPPLPRLPTAQPSKFPAFPAKAIIDASSPKFSGFIKERAPKTVGPAPVSSKDNTVGYSERPTMSSRSIISASRPAIAAPPRTAVRNSITTTAANDSPRTSFSFSMTEPDFTNGASETRKYRIGDIPMSSLKNSGLKPFEPITLNFHTDGPSTLKA